MKSLVAVLLTGAVLAGSHASAQLINFSASGNTPTGVVVLGSGAGGDANYNNLQTGSVMDSTGATVVGGSNSLTNLSEEYTDTGGTAITPGDDGLLAEYLYNNGGGTVVDTLTGLTAGDAFTLVVYASGDGAGQGASISVTSGSQNFGSAETAATDRLISGGQGDAYQEFTGTLNATNTALTITLTDGAATNLTLINGIQILESVPEPSTYVLLGLGLLFVVMTVRGHRPVKA